MSGVLVTGFGAFRGVDVNPTDALARHVDGLEVAGVPIVGRVLPVSYRRGPDDTVALARSLGVRLVVGLGVATGRTAVCVEQVAVRVDVARPDIDGERACRLRGPDRVRATVETVRLAEALGAELSEDAGRYVCNAWLYRVASELAVPVGFIHVPPEGMEPERLLRGIASLLG